eukprot:CAMPEP_0171172270 /NCGR_PEP_ID=MMETSP0790-20130122/9636_1 /TAXON_ID=2925 /ORGANISM="Alexandrium catenella, Strain OF101" /LENGTH=581 /DNA_ID=CAMNT_0011637129 /DNA_START=67 /DNA_END=1812 /DNA_ORIENTATION=-
MAPAVLLRSVIPAALFALSDATCVTPLSTTGYDTARCTSASASCSTNEGTFSLSGCRVSNKCHLPSSVPAGYDTTNCAATATDRKSVRQCTVACAANYAGTPAAMCSSNNGAFSFSGCAKTCTAPSTIPAEYDFTGCMGTKTTGQCSVSCATGYQGSVTDTCATAGGAFAVTGCTAKPTCTLPSSSSMYDTSSCAATSSSKLNVDQCTLTCATNYAGTPTKACGGSAFTFNGCARACTLPSTTTGYDVSQCQGTKSTSQCTLSCAAGYTGTASKTCSTAGGTFTLSGCLPLPTCTTPSTIPTGYIATACDTSSAGKNVQQCSMSCDTSNHYEGTASPVCSSNGGTFSFTGCTAKKVCHLPSSTTGYGTASCAATTSARLREDQCSVTCATGYAGTPTDSCSSNNGAFTFGGCSRACTLPSTTTGYDVSNCQGTKTSAQCTVSCASGYTGTAVDACSTAAGSHTLSGCSQAPQCALPTTTTGYITTGCAATTSNRLYASLCTVACDTANQYEMTAISTSSCGLTCASGYTGTPSASCPTSATDFTFSGCTSSSVAGGAARAESMVGILSAVFFLGRYLACSA